MTPAPRWWHPLHAAGATLGYSVVALAFTWPLATGLTHLVPWDLGDPLLNDWILAWHYHQTGRVLSGDWAALADWWHAPIFHPARYALGYSELLVAQAVLGAPLYALTGNLLLTYNGLFLASFVLSALGAFLLVRRMTGDAAAAWMAGLLYGFALYRVNQGPHLQVLHAQWAPFVLWLLHRWLDEGRWRDAMLGGVALAAQNLSNGYYLFYLALLLPPYVCAQLYWRRRLLDARAWSGVALMAGVAITLTVPLMYPYMQLRMQGHPPRPPETVAFYGADAWAWLTANDQLRLWGWMRPAPRAEGDLFPGLLPVLLTVLGVALTLAGRLGSARANDARDSSTAARSTHVVKGVAVVLVGWHSVAILLVLFAGVSELTIGPLSLSFSNGTRLLLQWAIGLALLLATSPRARLALRDTPDAPVVVLAALLLLTVWLSFGPVIRIGGRPAPSWPEVYSLLYTAVPGADALRVPPRIAMMTALLLAMLGGIGVACLRRHRSLPGLLVGILGLAFLAEAWPAPIPMNVAASADVLAAVPDTVPPRPADHPDAQTVARLPETAVLLDLPFGHIYWELRWQYLSAGHWRRRVNGYSGDFPPEHGRLDQVLSDVRTRGDEAAALLHQHGVTHVVLHLDAWRSPEPAAVFVDWLESRGARRVERTTTLDVWKVD